jgi:hypothetical protein
MKFKDILRYITDEELDFLSAETRVNHQVKKLDGSAIFKLILYSLLEHGKPSLRVMEECFNSAEFNFYNGSKNIETKYNSISDRLSTINVEYFRQIFDLLFDKFHKELKEENSIQKYDTTMVAISSKLVDWGMKVGSKTNKKQIKFTVGIHGSLPCSFKIFNQQKYLCEDLTIPEVILNYKYNRASIVTFDRGVQKKSTFAKFTDENIIFVTRLRTNVNYELIEKFQIPEYKAQEQLKIEEDSKVYFNDWKTKKQIQTPIRIIKVRINETNESIYFASNNFELQAQEIAKIYRERWKIEVFFRFIKQQLNFSQLINRNLNGIEVMVYMTLILAMMIIVYKRKNNLKGYKIVKMKITNELQKELIREIVILSGGNPDKVAHILDD